MKPITNEVFIVNFHNIKKLASFSNANTLRFALQIISLNLARLNTGEYSSFDFLNISLEEFVQLFKEYYTEETMQILQEDKNTLENILVDIACIYHL